jgi:protein adenylyltransferase
MSAQNFNFVFDNTYARDLDGFYLPWQGAKVPTPQIVKLNGELARELGLDPEALDTPQGADMLAGSVAPEGSTPLAQVYAGHQFGGFSPQLGDGRALLLGEVIDTHGQRRDIQLKGSGRTPFSRGGDGKAVLGPILREYLIGEAMHALGIPTTRALAAVTTGENVMRDGRKPGAVLARVAASHLRVGTFQYFAARGENDKVKQLADYAIARHFPELATSDNPYLALLSRVIEVQAALVAKWLNVGFVHGVMNTDNVTISGETIDYGPCAFLDAYDPNAVFSSIDREARYAYGNQPAIAQWNLARFAETLLVLIDPDDTDNAVRLATNEVNAMDTRFRKLRLEGLRAKIGLTSSEDGDSDLVRDMFVAMEGQDVDFTMFFRRLADAATGQDDGVKALFGDAAGITVWIGQWQDRVLRDPQSPEQRAQAMNRVNPVYIPRNHQVEKVLEAAENNADYAPFVKLLDVLSDPFRKRDGLEEYETPAPDDFGTYQTFCGT